MFVIQYDYATIEKLFGTFVADHFEIIFAAAIIIFIVVQYLFGDNRIHQNNEEPEIRNGWAYNESARMWVDPEQLDEEKNRRAYKENRKRWKEFQEREELEELHKKRMQGLEPQTEETPDHLSPEELKQANEIWKKCKATRKPSYEEWKAARQKEQGVTARSDRPTPET